MKRWFPRTLKSQTLLVLSGVFFVSNLAGLIIYEVNRDKRIVLTEAADLAARIAGIVDLATSFPQSDRQRILAAAQTQFLATFPEIPPHIGTDCQENEFAQHMLAEFNRYFSGTDGVDADVCVYNLDDISLLKQTGINQGFDVLVYINFPGGEQSFFHAVLPVGPSLFQDVTLIYIIMVGVLALLIAWYFIARIVTPIVRLADAADGIGMNIDAPALKEEGPNEVKIAARAFNRMQNRLRRMVHGQTEMIAAISHDLRSAITRLLLRAELLKDSQERKSFVRVVKDMQLMVQSVIDFIRGIDTTEKPRKTNIPALLESLCEDLLEEGYPVEFMTSDHSASIVCRPAALRRSFLNIIDNAVKYGKRASVTVEVVAEYVTIIIDDEGPGIVEEEIENVFRPFYRLELSRSRDTGGVGLGLAIAQGIIQAHGGTIRLFNRTQGGLRCEIRLYR